MASANRATGVHSPDTRGRRVLIDRAEGRHARVACATNTTSGERGALGDAGADQVRWVAPRYPRRPSVAARSSSVPPAMERVGLKCEPPTPLTGTKGRGALGCDYILRSACRRVRRSWEGKPADGYHESTRVSRAGHTASPASILWLDGRSKNASTARPTLAWCAGLRMNARAVRVQGPRFGLRRRRLRGPSPVAVGADVMLFRDGPRLARAACLPATQTEGSEQSALLRLDARADGSGAVDEPSCPRHSRFPPLREIGIVVGGNVESQAVCVGSCEFSLGFSRRWFAGLRRRDEWPRQSRSPRNANTGRLGTSRSGEPRAP